MSKPVTLTDAAKAYVDIHRQIERLKAQQAPLADLLKASGPIDIDTGTGVVVKVIDVAGRKTTKWALVAAAAKIPQTLIDQYTTTGAPSKRIDVDIA